MQGALCELRDGAGRPVYRRADALAPSRRRSSPGEAAAADMDEAGAEPAGTGAQLQQVRPGNATAVDSDSVKSRTCDEGSQASFLRLVLHLHAKGPAALLFCSAKVYACAARAGN